MMLDYEFTPRAVRDISAARDWYEAQRVNLGNRFVDAVLNAVRETREHPQRFSEHTPGVRAAGCTGFPYRVYYRCSGAMISILAVYHTARNPSNWNDPDRE